MIDKFGARLNQSLCGDAVVKRFAQPALKSVDVRLDSRAVEVALRSAARIRRLVSQGRGDSIR
ncbi:hypothetical protein QYS46_07455 [Klebsiella michiganensis]|nr:hypothetical protein [Klebsiella michiganensis]